MKITVLLFFILLIIGPSYSAIQAFPIAEVESFSSGQRQHLQSKKEKGQLTKKSNRKKKGKFFSFGRMGLLAIFTGLVSSALLGGVAILVGVGIGLVLAVIGLFKDEKKMAAIMALAFAALFLVGTIVLFSASGF